MRSLMEEHGNLRDEHERLTRAGDNATLITRKIDELNQKIINILQEKGIQPRETPILINNPAYDINTRNWNRIVLQDLIQNVIDFDVVMPEKANAIKVLAQEYQNSKKKNARADVSGLTQGIKDIIKEIPVIGKALGETLKCEPNFQGEKITALVKLNTDRKEIKQVMSLLLDIEENRIGKARDAYKDFKQRERAEILPIHPWIIETFRSLPHFILVGLAILISFNAKGAGASLFAFLISLVTAHWGGIIIFGVIPLVVGIIFELAARRVSTQRYVSEYSFQVKKGSVYNPLFWKSASVALRIIAFTAMLAGTLVLPFGAFTVPQQAV